MTECPSKMFLLLSIFLRGLTASHAVGISSCITCATFAASAEYVEPYSNQPNCRGTTSGILNQYSRNCIDVHPTYVGELGCQTLFFLAPDGVTVKDVFRGCIMISEGFFDLNITAARLPAGTCFKQQNFDGAPACVCTDRQNCNDKQFIGKNTKGEYVAVKDKPDSQGNVVATSGGPGSALSVDKPGSGSPPGNGGADNYAGTAADVSNNTAGGAGDGAGGQGGSNSGSQLSFRSTIFLIAFFFLMDMQPANARGSNL